MKAGVPCPPDIKRKLDRNNSRLMPSRRLKDFKDDEPGNEKSHGGNEKTDAMGKVSDGNLGDARAIISSLT